MNEGYTYPAIRQRMIATLRAKYDGREMLTQREAADVYGYKDAYKAEKAVLCNIPHYLIGKSKRYALIDIAADIARRATAPDENGGRSA